MQQFGASVFHMVVCWHKLVEVENNIIFLATATPKIIVIGENLTMLWQKQFWLFFIETWCKYKNRPPHSCNLNSLKYNPTHNHAFKII